MNPARCRSRPLLAGAACRKRIAYPAATIRPAFTALRKVIQSAFV